MSCQHCLFGSRADFYRQKCRHCRDHTINQHRNLIQRAAKVEANHSCNIEPAKHREHTERIFRIRVVKLYRFFYCLQFTGKPAVRQACTASRHKQRITAKQNRSNRAGRRRIANSHFSTTDQTEALLRALAPDTALYWGENGAEERVTSAQAREKLGAPQASLDFSDVDRSAYAGEINALAAYRIVFGDKGAFRPEDTMTRAEVCALLAQALDVYARGEGYFTDVPKDSWYAPSVNAMASLGLISGVGGGRFAPNATMTQEEFITVLGRLVEFLNLDARAYLDEHPLAILQPLAQYKGFSPWAIRCVDLLTSSVTDEDGNAVTMYCTDLARIEPKAPILREQAAAALYNALRTTGVLKY